MSTEKEMLATYSKECFCEKDCVIIKKMSKVGQSLLPFFWETDLEKVDIQRNKNFIIERILELGDRSAVEWLFTTYSTAAIKKTLEESRNISKKSKNFWKMILGEQQNV